MLNKTFEGMELFLMIHCVQTGKGGGEGGRGGGGGYESNSCGKVVNLKFFESVTPEEVELLLFQNLNGPKKLALLPRNLWVP